MANAPSLRRRTRRPAGRRPPAGAQRAADHARPVHQGPELREPARAAEPDRADPAAAHAQRPGHHCQFDAKTFEVSLSIEDQRQDSQGRAAVHAGAGLCRHGEHRRGAARPTACCCSSRRRGCSSRSPAPSSPTPRARRASRRSTSPRSTSWRSIASSSRPTAARCRASPAAWSGTLSFGARASGPLIT